jgi:heme-degrading monooxygenase HmoA
MIERHVTFTVSRERGPEFERFFAAEYLPAMSAQAGFVGAELLRAKEDPDHYQMVLRFASEEAAAAWRASPAHAALRPRLKALHSGSTVAAYEVLA